MPSTINADNGVSSGSAGLKSTADSSGVLALQTNGTTAISIDASQAVSFTNQPTYSGGTANGVAYLNGSKVLTTGSALVFDGTNLRVGTTSSLSVADKMTVVGGNFAVQRTSGITTFMGDNTVDGYAGTATNQAFTLLTNSVERLRLNTSGTVILQGGSTSANGVGITFPATQSASSDANTLDDYEEGTFTVTLTGSTSGAPGTYGTRNAYYTKIGRMVYVTLQVVNFSKGTLIGNLIVGGLPFTIQNSANATGTLRYELPSPTAGTTVILPQGADGATYLDIQLFTNAGFNGGYSTSGLSASATNSIYNLVYIYQTST